MYAKPARIAAATCLVVCLACAFGCSNPIRIKQEAQVHVTGTLLIVPLRDETNYYFDSKAGNAVALNAAKVLAVNSENVTCVDSFKVRGPLRSLFLDETIDAATWAQIGRKAGADYILYGSIDKLSWRDKDDMSLPACHFTISYTVVDTSQSREIFHTTWTGRYPIMLLADGGTSVYEMGRQGLRSRAYAYIGEVIAKTFYDHMITKFEALSLKEGSSTAPR